MLKTITMKQIQELRPCYSPLQYASENWTGDVLKILRNPNIPASDRLWVVLRKDFLDDKTLRLFAVAAAREALKLIPKPDPRSLKALEVAERFALGKATDQELSEARAAAYAAYYAAHAAAYAAAYAAYAAARAAYYAARAAAYDAAYDAAHAAAYDAARKQARNNQVKILINLITHKEGTK